MEGLNEALGPEVEGEVEPEVLPDVIGVVKPPMEVEVSEVAFEKLSEDEADDPEALEDFNELMLAVEELVEGGEEIMLDAQVTLLLDDMLEEELLVTLELEAVVADPLEDPDEDADPVVLCEVALEELETLLLTEVLIEDSVLELVLEPINDEEEGA